MQDLKLLNFKGFGDIGLELHLEGHKSLLLYGENGSGKTSLYESLKLFYYYPRLYENVIPMSSVGEERKARETMFHKAFGNKFSDTIGNWSVVVDGYSIEGLSSSLYNYPCEYVDTYQMFLISYTNLIPRDTISLDEILEHAYFPASINVGMLWNSDFVNDINSTLKEYFYEDVQVCLHNVDGHMLRLTINGTDSASTNLCELFNEAILHLVHLVILFQIVLVGYKEDKQNVLVLDDIITSLDVANRGLVAKYIVCKFENFQKIVLTHNVSYYNLFQYILHNCISQDKEKTLWIEKSMYLKNGTACFADKEINKDDVKQLCKEFYGSEDVDLNSFGNKIRKLFENMMYLYLQGVQLGARDEFKDILECVITPSHRLYYKITPNGKIDDVYCLLKDLEDIIKDNTNEQHLRDILIKKMSEYDVCDEYKRITGIIGELKIYQKLIMHPLSHATSGLCNFTRKEIVVVLELLEKLSAIVKSNKTINTTNLL